MKRSKDVLDYGFAWGTILLSVNMCTKQSYDN